MDHGPGIEQSAVASAGPAPLVNRTPSVYHEVGVIMAKLRFEINGKKGRVEFPTFTKATASFLALLNEIAGAVPSGADGRLSWYVDDLSANGSLLVEVHSQVQKRTKRQKGQPRDFSPDVAQSLVDGLENVEVHGTSPPYLSQGGLEKMNRLLGLLERNGAKGFTAGIPGIDREVRVGKKAVKNIAKLLPEKRSEIGSIEGRIEAINIHGKSRFVVYDSITKKGVTCRVDDSPSVSIDDIKDALGRKVCVSGVVSLNERSEVVSVRAQGLRVFRMASELPKASDLTGSDPHFTGDQSTEEYIRSIRSG